MMRIVAYAWHRREAPVSSTIELPCAALADQLYEHVEHFPAALLDELLDDGYWVMAIDRGVTGWTVTAVLDLDGVLGHQSWALVDDPDTAIELAAEDGRETLAVVYEPESDRFCMLFNQLPEPVAAQRCVVARELPVTFIESAWAAGAAITHVSSSSECGWIVLATFDGPRRRQRFTWSDDPLLTIETRGARERATAIAYDDAHDRWFIVLDEVYVHGSIIAARSDDLPDAFVRYCSAEGFYIEHLVRGRDAWMVVMSELPDRAQRPSPRS